MVARGITVNETKKDVRDRILKDYREENRKLRTIIENMIHAKHSLDMRKCTRNISVGYENERTGKIMERARTEYFNINKKSFVKPISNHELVERGLKDNVENLIQKNKQFQKRIDEVLKKLRKIQKIVNDLDGLIRILEKILKGE
jgi:hypothetical protein